MKDSRFKEELERLRFEKIQARQDWLSEDQIRRYWQSVAIDLKLPKSAAGFEKLVIEFLTLKGHFARKISVSGRMLDNTKIVKDVVGFQRIIGSKKYIPSTSKKGLADISCTIHSIDVSFEVKFSNGDRQSEFQKDVENKVNDSGGFYFIIKNLDDFYKTYLELLTHPKIVLMRDYEQNNKKI